MSTPSFGDVIRMIEIANLIYTYGFTKSHHAHVLYAEFGENIHHLALNLGDLQKVIQYIRRDGLPRSLDSAYFDSLGDIIGDYQTTLQDCDNLLRDKAKFKWQGNFIHNIVWNVTVASDIQSLKDRLAHLNIKLLTMLKTLDLGMAQQLSISMARIHRDLASRIDAARDEVIQHITALGLQIQGDRAGLPTAARPSSTVRSGPFEIQDSLDGHFKQQIQALYFDSNRLPLVLGLDSVVYHINEANKIPSDSRELKKERHWMEVAKASWILSKVKSGDEFKLACSFRPSNNFEQQMNDLGITVASYVKGLEIELLDITKAAGISDFTPDDGIIMDIIRNGNTDMLLNNKKEIVPTPSWELEFSEKIMSASLIGPYRGFDQNLHLFRLTDIDLKLVISDVRRNNGGPGETNNNSINVDLERARFIPLYATTTSSSSALNVNFQGDRLAAGSTALSFKKRSDLFKLQQAITGYKVVLEALNIKATPYISRIIGGSQREYTGRLQLWRAKRLKMSTQGTSGSITSSASPNSAAPSPPASAASSPNPNTYGTRITRQFSGANASETTVFTSRRDSAITMASKLSLDRRTSTATTSTAFSIATTNIKSSASTVQTSIVDKEGNIGIIIEKPEPSMLVLYLEQSKRSSGRKEQSFLAIQLDEETLIDTSACGCRKPDSGCRQSVIQRRDGKPLLTYRHDAGSDMDAWNLAKLGQWQRNSLASASERMRWVAVDFDTVEEKDKFGDEFGKLKTLFNSQQRTFRMDLNNIR